VDSSLDFKVLTKAPDRDKGPKIGTKINDTETKFYIPGPGTYNPKIVMASTQSTSFGKSKRELISNKQKDYRISYIDVFPSAGSKKEQTKGFTFSQVHKDRGSFSIPLGNKYIPGPGYYSIRKDITKPKSTSFSICSDTGYADLSKSLNTTQNIPFINPPSSIENTNSCKFSHAERFASNMKFRYKRILFGRAKTSMPIVKRNMQIVVKENLVQKLQKIATNGAILTAKIQTAQKTKEKLEEEEIIRKIQIKEDAERRRLISKEKSNTHKLIKNWLHLGTLGGMLQILSEKYNLKNAVKKRTDKLMRILFVSLWTVGKFIRKFNSKRMSKAKRSLKTIVNTHRNLWEIQRRVRAKRRIAKFIDEYAQIPAFTLFVMQISRQVIIIQKWYRRHLVRKRLLLAIMNYQWSPIEYAIIRGKLTDKTDKKICDERINECIYQSKKSDVVPLFVRIHYLKQQLNVFFIEFMLKKAYK